MRRSPICALALLSASALAGPEPLLCYTFDDMANPTANSGSLGAAYDGAVSAGIVFVPFGAGFAIEKSAPLDAWVVHGGDENAFDIADTDFTVLATVRTTFTDPAAPGGRFIVVKNETGSNDNWGLSLRPDTGEALFFVSADGQFVALFSCIPINDGAPHVVMGVRSGDRMGLYVDGVLGSAGDVPAGFPSTQDSNAFSVHIAGRSGAVGPSGGLNDEFVGIIDDVQIYDVALVTPGVASVADLAPSYGRFDFSDVIAFLQFFADEDPRADLAPPAGVFDFSDVIAFLTAFAAGCP